MAAYFIPRTREGDRHELHAVNPSQSTIHYLLRYRCSNDIVCKRAVSIVGETDVFLNMFRSIDIAHLIDI